MERRRAFARPSDREAKQHALDRRDPILVATEDINDGDRLMKVPVTATLNQMAARNIKSPRGYLGEMLKDLFKFDQRWGLAVMTLHEYFKATRGEKAEKNAAHGPTHSKFRPFLHTLRMHAFSA